MFKKVLTFGLLVCVLAFVACSGEKEDEPPATTGTAAKPASTPEPEITYAQGFYDLEREGATSWRWMSEQGIVKLKNSGKDMKLHIVGDIPADQIPNPTCKISFNGETLEEFSVKTNVDKEYVIPAAKQGGAPTSELTVSLNKHFVPKQVNPKSGDERKLSLSLRQLTWEAK